MMHHQLHHEADGDKVGDKKLSIVEMMKTPKMSPSTVFSGYSGDYRKYGKDLKSLRSSSSATRLFDKLRSRICRSKVALSTQNEETNSICFNDINANDSASECTSKAARTELLNNDCISDIKTILPVIKDKEIYSCHLCDFDADRITVLDRHLLDDHKLDLESLLKLVIAKTKEGVSNIQKSASNCAIREPYYKCFTEELNEGEFIIKTVTPKVKILKHSSTNTDIEWNDIPNLKNNCNMITKELKKMIGRSNMPDDKEDFMEKMQTLNDYMCKFMNSTYALKRTLTKEFGSGNSIRERLGADSPFLNLSLDDNPDTPRDWERAHSEKVERHNRRHKYGGDNSRDEKKLVAESFYF